MMRISEDGNGNGNGNRKDVDDDDMWIVDISPSQLTFGIIYNSLLVNYFLFMIELCQMYI